MITGVIILADIPVSSITLEFVSIVRTFERQGHCSCLTRPIVGDPTEMRLRPRRDRIYLHWRIAKVLCNMTSGPHVVEIQRIPYSCKMTSGVRF